MKTDFFKTWLAIFFVLFGLQSKAADIDLFAGIPISGNNGPNVLFVMDNAANFSASVTDMRCSITAAGVVDTSGAGTAPTNLDKSAGAVEQCALYSALSSLTINAAGSLVNIGVMAFNSGGMQQFNPVDNSFSPACVNGTGGCLLMPIVPFNSVTKPNILGWIRNWATGGGSNYVVKSNNAANGAVMQEAWAYYFGKTGVSGRSYSAIAPAAGCASKNVVFIGNAYRNNGSAGDGTNEANSPLIPLIGASIDPAKWANPPATTLQQTVITGSIQTSCSTSNTTLATAEGSGVYALNWARYMKAQGVTTFSIGVLGPSCSPDYAAHLTKLGSDDVGGGGFFPSNNFNDLKAAIATVVGKIQAVNSVFAAVSLPVSVNTQGTYLNQVFIGMFRPQSSFLPRWFGNLKQYKIGMDSVGSLQLLDADSLGAINNGTGFIDACARSYWTPNVTDSYWTLAPSGSCKVASAYVTTPAGGSPAEADMKSSNTPDGNIVEKGAQGYSLRAITPVSRNVKTCSPTFGSCTAMTNFDTSNTAITQTLLNPGGSDAATLINWARGTNTENEMDATTAVMRPSVHGDVVHSKPVAVNYGSIAPSVVVYYGANDGMLRAVNGNRGSPTDSTVGQIGTYTAGSEMWSFMPPEFYGNIKRLHDNTIAISYPLTASATSTGEPKDYGFDGPFTAFKGTVGGANKTYLYATMRRGGRAIYAFDVSTPGTPSLLWKKGCPNLSGDTGCINDSSGDFTGIGQTWSSLKTIYATGYGAGATPMVITGGGYDKCEDYDAGVSGGKNHNCISGSGILASKGHKVYVMDAATGTIVKSFNTDRSVIADSVIVLDSMTGLAKYAYTADLGGNVYRISFIDSSKDNWTITKIASLGCSSPAVCTDSAPNRKFMFVPSVVTTDNITFNLMLGSGDREKPILQYAASSSVSNYFFMIKDKPSDASWLTSENANCGANVLCMASLLSITAGTPSSAVSLGSKKGWYLNLASTEQVVTSAITVFGVTTFSTHQPPVTANSCSNGLGTTLVYNINYLDATSPTNGSLIYAHVTGDSLPPSPVAGQVTLDNGSLVPFCIGCRGDSPEAPSSPGMVDTVTRPTKRVYWYIKK